MLKSYFTIAWRRLLRNRLVSIINIGGLMLGLTTGIIICLVLVYVFGFDKFHKNYKDIHVVEMNQSFGGILNTGSATPGPLGPAVRKAIPGLKYVVRTQDGGQSLTRYKEKIIYQKSIYAEPDFFHMMTFPALEGDPVATLREGSGVVLTQSAAQRLFGTERPVGKSILLDNNHPLKVGAIIRDIPQNSSLQFDLILPLTLFEKDNSWVDSWDNRSMQTWVQLLPGANLQTINRQMTELLLKNSNLKQVSLFAYPIARLNLFDNFKDGKPYWGKAYLYVIIAFIAFLTLLIACINFMNLSTAMAEHRAREVGLRKVLGASRRVIIGQFLGESVLLAMLALILSIGLAYLVLPWFAAFEEMPLTKQFGYAWVWVLLFLVGLFTGIIAGSYPALFLSRFQPVQVLKRLMSIGRKGALRRKGLVSFQFIISIFLILSTIAEVKQIRYIENRPLGYEPSNLVDITANGELPSKFDLFKNKVSTIAGVVNIAACADNLVRFGTPLEGLSWPGKSTDQDFILLATWVNYDWVKTTGMQLAEGRDFSPEFGTDSAACLINEAAVKKMGLKEPVLGTRISGKTVIGVLRNIVFNSPGGALQPLVVYHGNYNFGHFLVRLTNDGQWKEQLAQIENTVKSLNPGYPFTFRFTTDEHEEYFKNDHRVIQLSNIFSIMAILISCLGLFGLASFLVEKRTKEISIRKVLGASPAGLWLSLSWDMLKPVLLGIIIATPLAVLSLTKLLTISDYHIRLSGWIFIVTGVGAVIIALAIVSFHSIKAAHVNPARSLQTE
ncbi:MAG: FtsX-like permease family protein [Bacteroidota bacterium]